ncbi:MAG: pyruvate carboxylase, partial [Planctomycetaceae bacterium]|nr:pyruvate carboxylase [Planctomycetaceae bacterium]
ICYTGDILNPRRTKYNLKYYIDLARQLEERGAQILAIKDMAGLCKPDAAEQLVRALKQEIGIPIHFHTHDTAGIQAASVLLASHAGVDIVDAAMAPMSGGTSQVNLNTLCESLAHQSRATGLDPQSLDDMADYWRAVREFYLPFESVVLPGTADLYNHEMPGGQYTNLYEQARALGMADRWSDVCCAYAQVNQLLGDIVKVTPTSKAVGDMALFMVANRLTSDDVLHGERELNFPESVVDLVSGAMGQPIGGFPEAVRKRILKDRPAFEGRPGATLPPVDFELAAGELGTLLGRRPSHREVLSSLLYPQVFRDFATHRRNYGDTSVIPTPTFFFGMQTGEEFGAEIEPGKTLFIKYFATGSPHPDGTRTVFFELNGQPRDVTVEDHAIEATVARNVQADPTNPAHVAATMPGVVVNVAVAPGDKVAAGQKLLIVEAMKMQTTFTADRAGTVGQLLVSSGTQIATGDLLLTIE